MVCLSVACKATIVSLVAYLLKGTSFGHSKNRVTDRTTAIFNKDLCVGSMTALEFDKD
jgi:hypothetical protein